MTESFTWVIMPILSGRDYTTAAIADVLDQSIPTRLLLINQGVDADFRDELERVAEAHADRVFLWSHHPPLPSLAATWNRALDFVWACGGTEALVVNNDVRLRRDTLEILSGVIGHTDALFVSAVGRREGDVNIWEPIDTTWYTAPGADGQGQILPQFKGGPDFSCFLISRDCHAAYRFDENFVPAYCEDLDTHRRMLLGGDGARIFSVPLPYLHYASGTLKQVDAAQRAQIEAAISAGSRAYYQQKWGGPVNQERYRVPRPAGTDALSAQQLDDLCRAVDDGTATTPALQEAERQRALQEAQS